MVHSLGVSYRELAAWQRAMDLCNEVYCLTDGFPRHELYGLTAQLRRASVRVASCIAEGEGRSTQGEQLLFLGYARGSLYEIDTQLIIASRRGYLNSEAVNESFAKARATLDGYFAYVSRARD